jgi:hypothetical protein
MVALVAALLLVLQSALGSVAMGGEPVQRDIFGNVICTDSRPGQNPAHDGGGHLPNCCLLGCASGIQGAADIPGEAAAIEAPQSHDAASFPVAHHPFVFATQRRQGNPRAPPLAA